MIEARAYAKLNLALVAGRLRDDGKHEIATVLQLIELHDEIALEPARSWTIEGFTEDTLVRGALEALAQEAGGPAAWKVRITKRIPVAAGLGGGSSDAATALRLANDTSGRPLDEQRLHALAAGLGADVPFFLRRGPQLGTGDGSTLEPLDLPQDYWVVLVLPHGERKPSTGEVYRRFDRRGGENGYEERAAALRVAVGRVRRARELSALPGNDLASSPLADELRRLGAFRADVSGAGPAVYGLFTRRVPAVTAVDVLRAVGRTWLTVPAWYGDPR